MIDAGHVANTEDDGKDDMKRVEDTKGENHAFVLLLGSENANGTCQEVCADDRDKDGDVTKDEV